MIDQALEKKLNQMTKRFTNMVKKSAEEYGLKLDVAVRLNIKPSQEKEEGVNNGGS